MGTKKTEKPVGIKVVGGGNNVFHNVTTDGYEVGMEFSDTQGNKLSNIKTVIDSPAQPSPKAVKPSLWSRPLVKLALVIVGTVVAAAAIHLLGIK